MALADPELRREVESLLAEPIGGEFMDRPAIQNTPQLLQDSIVTELGGGACLGPYRIEKKLGEGGMGEVFRAVDTRLGRAVAIKTTRAQFSARFKREARAIASLNPTNGARPAGGLVQCVISVRNSVRLLGYTSRTCIRNAQHYPSSECIRK